MQIKRLDKTDSTNTWVSCHETELEPTSLVYCAEQTAGRGQRGNSWESEPGKNITASLLFHPEHHEAVRQFELSEAVALALADYLKYKGVEANVKWPNDIYVGGHKISGILVEHVITGKNITRTIAGFGLNINQKKFISNAPNPISLTQLTGLDYDIEKEILKVAECLERRLSEPDASKRHSEFLQRLWRNDGKYHPFKDNKHGEMIMARIKDVDKTGILTLQTDSGEEREYAFKEIEFILHE